MTGGAGGRRNARVVPETRMHIELHGIMAPMRIVDISIGGFASHSKRPFKIGETYRFTITLPDQQLEVTLAAVSVHCRATPSGADLGFVTGWKFLAYGGEDARMVRAIVAAAVMLPAVTVPTGTRRPKG